MHKFVSPLNAYLCLPEVTLSDCFILISRCLLPSAVSMVNFHPVFLSCMFLIVYSKIFVCLSNKIILTIWIYWQKCLFEKIVKLIETRGNFG